MRSESGWCYGAAAVVDQSALPNARPQRLLAGAALTCVGALCAWTIVSNVYGDAAGNPDRFGDRFEGVAIRRAGAAFADRFDIAALGVAAAAARGDKLAASVAARFAALVPSSPAISNAYASLFDRRFSLGYTPSTFVRSAALAPQQEPQQENRNPRPRGSPS